MVELIERQDAIEARDKAAWDRFARPLGWIVERSDVLEEKIEGVELLSVNGEPNLVGLVPKARVMQAIFEELAPSETKGTIWPFEDIGYVLHDFMRRVPVNQPPEKIIEEKELQQELITFNEDLLHAFAFRHPENFGFGYQETRVSTPLTEPFVPRDLFALCSSDFRQPITPSQFMDLFAPVAPDCPGLQRQLAEVLKKDRREIIAGVWDVAYGYYRHFPDVYISPNRVMDWVRLLGATMDFYGGHWHLVFGDGQEQCRVCLEVTNEGFRIADHRDLSGEEYEDPDDDEEDEE